MAILINMKPQPLPDSAQAATSPTAPCGLAKVVRTPASMTRKARKIHACPPAATQTSTARLTATDIPLWLPPPGRSVYHRRWSLDALTSMQQLLAQQDISTNVLSGAAGTPPDAVEFDPHLNDLAYSLIADVVSVAGHLMDKVDVSAASFLWEKLEKKTANSIFALRERLVAHGLDSALAAFDHAVDPAPYKAFLSERPPELRSRAVYDQINLSAGFLVLTMLEIALNAQDGPAEDWPDDIEVIEAYPAAGVPQNAPAAAAAIAAAPPAVATRAAGKRAKRIGAKATPRRKR